jgi:hypothetical protein
MSSLAVTSRPLPIFIHIHKCAGSSLGAVLRRGFSKFKPTIIPSSSIDSLAPHDFVQSVLKAALRDGYVMGHVGFGTHLAFCSPCEYFTMLRRPKDRLVSLWRYSSTCSEAFYYDYARGLTLNQFLSCRSWPLEIDNGLVRFLSGDPNGSNIFINPKPFGSLDESDLERALYNLEHSISGFGIVKRFDASLLLLKPLIHAKSILYGRVNASPRSAPVLEFPHNFFDLVQFDEVLYSRACSIFESRLLALSPNINSSLARFSMVNNLLGPLLTLKNVARSRLKQMIVST